MQAKTTAVPDLKLRDAGPADYEAIAAIFNANYPRPITAQTLVEDDQNRAEKCRHRAWIAAVDGQPVGYADYDQSVWSYHPHHFGLNMAVLPEFQGRGIGSTLYDTLMADLAQYAPQKLKAYTYGNLVDALRFLEKRGFTVAARFVPMVLPLEACDPAQFDPLLARLEAEGIHIKNLAEIADDPDHRRKLWDLDWDLSQDLPGETFESRISFADWQQQVIDNPRLVPEAYIAAIDANTGTYIGLSSLWLPHAGDVLGTDMTGVRQAYRRRGIATAMKARAMQRAVTTAYAAIRTANEANNVAMLAINQRLGYQRQPDSINLEKIIEG